MITTTEPSAVRAAYHLDEACGCMAAAIAHLHEASAVYPDRAVIDTPLDPFSRMRTQLHNLELHGGAMIGVCQVWHDSEEDMP